MMGGGGCLMPPPSSAGFRQHQRPLVVYALSLTKQGHRLLSSLAATNDPLAAVGLLRRFVASNSKHVALTTLSHLLSSPASTSHPHLSSFAFPLYSIIKQESWFSWNAKLAADLIAFLHKEDRTDEAESLFEETVSRLGSKERDLCMFYCNLIGFHAKHKSEKGVLEACTELGQLILLSSSVYVKRRGYESIVAGFSEVGLPDRAENWIQEMREKGLRPSAFELRYLVYGYGQMGFLQDMTRSVAQMEAEGFELDTVCYNMVLSSFGAHNKPSDMLSWLKKMRISGVPLSIRTHNSVLNSCPTIILSLQDLKDLPLSVDELVDSLSKDEADLVLELVKSRVLDQVMEWKPSELKLDLHGMHLATSYLILLQWFDELRQKFVVGNELSPTEILVVCGCGKHSSTRGESPVKSLVKEIIMRKKCPLRIDRKNTGCFIGKAKNFRNWLCQQDSNKITSNYYRL